MRAFGAFSERWTLAAHTRGPVQSCGAIGSPNASAMAATALPSVIPPPQPRPSITTLAPPVEVGRRDARAAAGEGVLVERPDLHGGDPLREETLRQFARTPVKERVEILVRARGVAGGREPPVRHVRARRRADIPIPRT